MNKPKVKKRTDGRFERKITLYDGITGQPYTVHVYAYTQVELAEKIRRLQVESEGLAKNQYTVAGFIKYFMTAKKENDSGTSTLDTYQHLINNYITGTGFAAMNIASVNVPACRQFLREFVPVNTGSTGTRTKQLLYTFLHAVFRQAWKERVIRENPFDFVDKPKHESKERLTLTKEEFDVILDNIESKQMKRIFIFARNTGLRRGEICGLRVQDLFLDDGYVAVRHGVKLHQGEWTFGKLKTKSSERTVVIPPSIVTLIREQLAFITAKAAKHEKTITPDSFVFQNRFGGFLLPSSLSRAFCEIRHKLKYPEAMTFHSLRATVATYLAEHDVNPKKIQAKLGHSTVTMTLNKYVKKTPEMESGLIDLLNEF